MTLALLVSITASGCYLGRTPAAKTNARIINGLAIAAGVSLLAIGLHDGSKNGCEETNCVQTEFAGGAIAGAGLAALLVGALVPTTPATSTPVDLAMHF
ncbi:MAG TPA: hypothetical protein VGM90_03630 [Kofleriaceae bacterium]